LPIHAGKLLHNLSVTGPLEAHLEQLCE